MQSESTTTVGPMEQLVGEALRLGVAHGRAIPEQVEPPTSLDVWVYNVFPVAEGRKQDAIRELFRQGLLHAALRTHGHIPDACDGCTAVEKAIAAARGAA